jgi:hypothetical protein
MKTNFYTCPYCNKEYTEPSELAHCILSCEDKKKQEEEERKKTQLAAERETRMKEIEAVEKHYYELVQSYIKDYGNYSTTRRSMDFPAFMFF